MSTPPTLPSLWQLSEDLLLDIRELVTDSEHALDLVLVNHRFYTLFFRHLCKLGESWRGPGGALGWAACQDNLSAATAFSRGQSWVEVSLATRANRPEIVEFLLPMIADRTELHPTREAPSALYIAIQYKCYESAKILIADPKIMPEKDYLWDTVLLKVISLGDLEMLKILWPHRVVQSLGLTEDDYKQAIEYYTNNIMVAYLEECQRTLLPVGDATKEGTGTEEGMTAEAEADAGDVMASGSKVVE